MKRKWELLFAFLSIIFMFYILWFSYFIIALKAELEILSDKGFVALNSGNSEFLTAVKKYLITKI